MGREKAGRVVSSVRKERRHTRDGLGGHLDSHVHVERLGDKDGNAKQSID
jgi:hypothetical protein